MPRKCCVPECRANYNAETTRAVFRFPADPSRLEQWKQMIPRNNYAITFNTVVCENHFEEKFKTLRHTYKNKDGQEVTREKPLLRLTKDAYPTIFNFDHPVTTEPKYAKKRKTPTITKADRKNPKRNAKKNKDVLALIKKGGKGNFRKRRAEVLGIS